MEKQSGSYTCDETDRWISRVVHIHAMRQIGGEAEWFIYMR